MKFSCAAAIIIAAVSLDNTAADLNVDQTPLFGAATVCRLHRSPLFCICIGLLPKLIAVGISCRRRIGSSPMPSCWPIPKSVDVKTVATTTSIHMFAFFLSPMVPLEMQLVCGIGAKVGVNKLSRKRSLGSQLSIMEAILNAIVISLLINCQLILTTPY